MPVAVPPLPFPDETLAIVPLADPVMDEAGFDPRSAYVEEYWLGILGPSTTWLLRRMAAGLDAEPDGFLLDLAETSQALGLGERQSRHSPFARALVRCVHFDLAQPRGLGVLAVRRKVPALNRRQVQRLPNSLQSRHLSWQQTQVGPATEESRRRACQLALSLLELGEPVDAAERQLGTWRYPAPVIRDAVTWAVDRHRAASVAAGQARLERDRDPAA